MVIVTQEVTATLNSSWKFETIQKSQEQLTKQYFITWQSASRRGLDYAKLICLDQRNVVSEEVLDHLGRMR
jgi:hypothetical protein